MVYRAGPRPALSGHACRARHRAAGRWRRLSLRGHRPGHRRQRGVPDETTSGGAARNPAGGAHGRRQGEVVMMFITRKHLSRRTVAARHGRGDLAAAARRDDPGRHGTREHGRRAEAAARVLLLSARRHHGEVDARHGGPRLRAEPHPRAARAVPQSAHRRQQSRQQAGREPRGACAGAGHVAVLRASERGARA